MNTAMKNKREKPRCECCGFVPTAACQMDVHHVDHDRSNNDPGNLMVLCANCHRLMHARPEAIHGNDRFSRLVRATLRLERCAKLKNEASRVVGLVDADSEAINEVRREYDQTRG